MKRNVLKGGLAIALLAASLLGPACAQDAETLKAAQDLSAIMTGGTVEQMTNALVGQMWPGIEGQLGGKVDAATVTEMRGEIERLLNKFVTDSLKDTPTIYARHFTLSELRELVAFYKTPTGAKAIRELPKVTAESYALIVPRMGPFQREIGTALQAIMKKHGYKD